MTAPTPRLPPGAPRHNRFRDALARNTSLANDHAIIAANTQYHNRMVGIVLKDWDEKARAKSIIDPPSEATSAADGELSRTGDDASESSAVLMIEKKSNKHTDNSQTKEKASRSASPARTNDGAVNQTSKGFEEEEKSFWL